jgi:glycogen operon protein
VLRSAEHETERLTLSQLIGRANKCWHGVKLNQPDWCEDSRSIALTVQLQADELFVHLIFNSYWDALEFELPREVGHAPARWQRWIDTALQSPHDIVEWTQPPPVPGYIYRAESRSVVVLVAGAGAAGGSA